MSTVKPRITITLEPHTHEVLSRLSSAGGDSMSALVAQLVEVALPSMERLVVVLERAASAPEEARSGFAAAIERAEQRLLPALSHAQDMGDLFLFDMEKAARDSVPEPSAAAQRRRGAPASAPARGARQDPRLVTRGSGVPGKGRKGVPRG